MLLTRINKTFRDSLNGAGSSVALIPTSRPHVSDSENVQRASDVAFLAKAKGMGVLVLEGRRMETPARELFVLVVGDDSIGIARKVIREADAASDWFLFCRHGDDLVKENIDRSRKQYGFKGDGFRLPDGGEVEFGAAYTPAQFNTAWCHSMGANVGEYLRAS
jgi:hypothetical protein